MLFPGTKENHALAEATISRLKAEGRMEGTKASLFKIGGYCTFVVCLGLGFGAAFFGYSSIKKAQSSSEQIANILAMAIRNSSVAVKGDVKLLPGAIVSLMPGVTVSLDPSASIKVVLEKTVQPQDNDPFTIAARPKLNNRPQ